MSCGAFCLLCLSLFSKEASWWVGESVQLLWVWKEGMAFRRYLCQHCQLLLRYSRWRGNCTRNEVCTCWCGCGCIAGRNINFCFILSVQWICTHVFSLSLFPTSDQGYLPRNLSCMQLCSRAGVGKQRRWMAVCETHYRNKCTISYRPRLPPRSSNCR